MSPQSSLNHFYGGIFSEFLLTNHFDLSVPEAIFGLSQEPLVYAHLLAKRWVSLVAHMVKRLPAMQET